MIDRRSFVSGLAAGILTAPRAAEAQQVRKVARIGVLGDTSPPVETSYSGIAAFLQGLRDLGYEEGRGRQVTIEYRWAEGQRDRLADLAADLVRSGVDVRHSSVLIEVDVYEFPDSWSIGFVLASLTSSTRYDGNDVHDRSSCLRA